MVPRIVTGRLPRSWKELSKTFINESMLGIFILDCRSGQFTTANPRFCEELGYSQAQITQLLAKDLFWEGNLIANLLDHKNIASEELTQTCQFIKSDGSLLTASVEFYLLPAESLMGTFKKIISGQSQPDAAGKASGAYLRAVVDISGIMLSVTDTRGHYLHVNTAYAEQLGYSIEELLTMTSLDITLTDEIDGSLKRRKELFDGVVPSYHVEKRYIHKSGKIIWEDMSVMAIRDENGVVTEMISAGFNITEKKQAEEAVLRLNEELEQHVASRTASLAASNKELEAFSYSVAHDLRSPLRTMMGFSQIILGEYGDLLDAQGRDYLNRIQNSSLTMSKLIDDLLKMSRITRAEIALAEVDLIPSVKDIFQNLCREHPERTVELVYPECLVVRADSSLIRVVLENLLDNAWKFSAKNPDARIELGMDLQDAKTTVFVKDNGIGFDMAYQNKLFGAFQRLHRDPDFDGTGIGLSIVQRIVHRHGGQVWAKGKIGSGATFYFNIPVY